MTFWEQAFGWGWVTADQLRLIVITEELPMGELTKEDFKRITGEEFEPASEVPQVLTEPEPKKK